MTTYKVMSIEKGVVMLAARRALHSPKAGRPQRRPSQAFNTVIMGCQAS